MLTIVRRLFGMDPAERARQEERERNARRAYAAQLIREAFESRNRRAQSATLRLAPASSRTKS